MIGGINAAIGYGLGVVRSPRRSALRVGAAWWPRRPTGAVRPQGCRRGAVRVGQRVDDHPRRRLATAGIRRDGHRRSVDPELHAHAGHRACGRRCAGGCRARILLDTIKSLARFFIRRWHVNDEVALFIGTAIVVVLIIMLVNGVLIRGFIAASSAISRPQNVSTRAGIVQPTQPERSGSPQSFAPFDTLGYQGRNFVGHRPARRRADRTQRPARKGTHPDLRRTGDRRHRRCAGERDPVRVGSAPRRSTASCW